MKFHFENALWLRNIWLSDCYLTRRAWNLPLRKFHYLCGISSFWWQRFLPCARKLIWPLRIRWGFGCIASECTCMMLHGRQILLSPRKNRRLRNLTFKGWSQECWTSRDPRMCCLLRPFFIRFWWHVSTFRLPSRVSCVHIQACTTRKLVVE